MSKVTVGDRVVVRDHVYEFAGMTGTVDAVQDDFSVLVSSDDGAGKIWFDASELDLIPGFLPEYSHMTYEQLQDELRDAHELLKDARARAKKYKSLSDSAEAELKDTGALLHKTMQELTELKAALRTLAS